MCIRDRTATSPKILADTFIDYYRTYGFGDIANFRAFRWNDTKKLIGIRHFDKMSIDEIIGYESVSYTHLDVYKRQL